MQVILLEKVVNLGGLGDVVKVKDGFARNYLIPQGKAKRATRENLKEFEARRAELEKAQAEALGAAQERGAKLDGLTRPDHAEGGRRRPPVRLGHQLRHRRGAEGARPRGRARGDPHAAGPAEAVGDHPIAVALHTDVVVTSRCRSWASRAERRRGRRARPRAGDRPDPTASGRTARVESSRGSHARSATWRRPSPRLRPIPQLVALRVPPHSIEAEQSVLGGLLLDNGAWDKHRRHPRARRLLPRRSPTHLPPHRAADRAGQAGRRRHRRRVDRGERGQGPAPAAWPTSARSRRTRRRAHNIRRYAEIVRERAVHAQPRAVGTEIADSALNPVRQGGRAAARRGRVEDLPDRRGRQPRPTQGFHDIQPLLTQVVERIDFLYSRENPSDVTGVATGFADLDQMTSGLQEGDLIIVAGRPSMGKTALGAQHRRARRGGREAAGGGVQHGDVGSAARDAHARLDRRASTSTSCAPAGSPTRTGAARRRARQAARGADLHRRDAARSTRSSCARARGGSHRQYGKLGLIVVDYLQLMSAERQARREPRDRDSPRSRAPSRRWRRSSTCRSIALSQLNRSVEHAAGQAADHVGPARVGRHRAGRRRHPVHLPRRVSTTRDAEAGQGRDHHRQAA